MPSDSCSSSLEVFVVDNASDDGSVAMVRKRFPWVRLIENEENVGFARANNQAIRLATSRYILLLNSDTVLQPGALRAMVAFMDAHPTVGALGPRLLNEDRSFQGSYADFPTFWSAVLGTDFRRHARPCHDGEALLVDAVSGACIMARREAVAVVGGLDEDYHLFVEEVDWCYRIRQAGWQVCHLPTAQIVHLLGRSRRSRSWFSYLNLHRSRLLFFRKHYGLRPCQLLRWGYGGIVLAKFIAAWLGAVLGRGSAFGAKRDLNRQLLCWLLFEQDVLPRRIGKMAA